jgi:hypothetical protein
MSTVTPLDIFDSAAAIASVIDISWSQNAFGPWRAHYNVMTWSLSAQHDSSSPIYDYYLVQLDGDASFLSTGAWRLDSHSIEVGPHGDGVELIETSPSTTIDSTSYTTGITTTVGGSVGFMGEIPTGSASASVSMNNSSSRNISDVNVENISMSSGQDSASWRFIVAPGSLTAQSDCSVNVEILYRTPHGAGLIFDVTFGTFLAGGGQDEICALIPTNHSNGSDGPEEVEVMTSFHGDVDPYFSDKAALYVVKTVNLVSPPAPILNNS